MAMPSTASDTLLPMLTSGCQLLPGLCISLHDGQFAEQGRGIYRIEPHGEQLLDVLVADFSDWDADQRPEQDVLLGQAMQVDASPQAIVQTLHARARTQGMPATASMRVLYVRVDLQHGQVSWVSCGAPPLLVFLASGESRSLGTLQAALTVSQVPIREGCFAWHAGDALLLAMNTEGTLEGTALAQAMVEQRQLHNTPAMALHGLRAAWLEPSPHPAGTLLVLLQQHAPGVNLDRLELPVSLDMLTLLREFVTRNAQHAGLSDDKEAGLVLAAVEVVTNVVRHAQELMLEAPIEVLIEHVPHQLVLSVRYFGQAYVPAVAPQARDLSTYPEGGFGQYIIQQVCDQVHYGHDAGVNWVQLTLSTGA